MCDEAESPFGSARLHVPVLIGRPGNLCSQSATYARQSGDDSAVLACAYFTMAQAHAISFMFVGLRSSNSHNSRCNLCCDSSFWLFSTIHKRTSYSSKAKEMHRCFTTCHEPFTASFHIDCIMKILCSDSQAGRQTGR